MQVPPLGPIPAAPPRNDAEPSAPAGIRGAMSPGVESVKYSGGGAAGAPGSMDGAATPRGRAPADGAMSPDAAATPRSRLPPSLFSTTSIDQLRALENVALFGGARDGDDSDSDDGGAPGAGGAGAADTPPRPRRRWWRVRAFKEAMVALLMAGVFAMIGGIWQQTKHSAHYLLFYFLGSLPLTYAVMGLIVWIILMLCEWFFFRERLMYLRPLQRPLTFFFTSILALGWAKLILGVWGCAEGLCDSDIYVQAKLNVWKALGCVILFTFANLVRSILAKVISRAFYTSAHYQKAGTALENEYFLLALSTPREELAAKREREAASLGISGVLSGLSRSKGGAKSPQDSEARDRVGEMRPFDFPAAGPGGAGRKAAAPVEQRLHSAVTGMAGAHPLLQAGALGASQRRRAPGSPGALSPRSPGGTPAPRPAGDVELGAAGAAGAAGANNVNGGAVLKRLRTSLAGRRGGGGDGDAGAEQGRKGRPRERVPKPLTQAELRRMREAVAIKTFSALVHRYAKQTDEDTKREMASAREFGFGLFHNIKGDAPRDYITIDDLAFFLEGPATQRAFVWLDRDHDGQIGPDEVADAVASLISGRADLAATLQDTDSIVASLATVIGVVLHVVFIAFYLLIFGIDIIKGFSTLSAAVLALTFVFGESLKHMFENSIYLFVAHAFDVGDVLQVAGETVTWRVKKIGLMNSLFLKANGEMVCAPNSKLRTSAVTNLSRSRNKADSVAFTVDFPASPTDVKAQVVEALKAHCLEGAAATEFAGAPSVTWRDTEPPLKLRLNIAYTLSFSGDQAARAFAARDGLIAAAAKALAAACASYTSPISAGAPLRPKAE